jgi:Protein of unknown function (DUF429)
VEVYPAAALKYWGLPHQRYKKAKGAILRGQALDRLLAKLPTLSLDGDALDRCQHSDDAFDALVCALVARAAALRLTTPPCPGNQTERAHVEGWIHVPTCDMTRLQQP